MAHLSLYHSPRCFYCVRVRSVMDPMNLAVELRDVRQQPHFRQELIRALGRGTVPVLRIEADDGQVEWVPESRVIIQYLRMMRPNTT